jgi:hypothetical protein
VLDTSPYNNSCTSNIAWCHDGDCERNGPHLRTAAFCRYVSTHNTERVDLEAEINKKDKY